MHRHESMACRNCHRRITTAAARSERYQLFATTVPSIYTRHGPFCWPVFCHRVSTTVRKAHGRWCRLLAACSVRFSIGLSVPLPLRPFYRSYAFGACRFKMVTLKTSASDKLSFHQLRISSDRWRLGNSLPADRARVRCPGPPSRGAYLRDRLSKRIDRRERDRSYPVTHFAKESTSIRGTRDVELCAGSQLESGQHW